MKEGKIKILFFHQASGLHKTAFPKEVMYEITTLHLT